MKPLQKRDSRKKDTEKETDRQAEMKREKEREEIKSFRQVSQLQSQLKKTSPRQTTWNLKMKTTVKLT